MLVLSELVTESSKLFPSCGRNKNVVTTCIEQGLIFFLVEVDSSMGVSLLDPCGLNEYRISLNKCLPAYLKFLLRDEHLLEGVHSIKGGTY